MFAVDHVLVSDALLDAPFACHLGACLGGCCVHGDRGAPLEFEECAALDAALPVVQHGLRPEAREVIAREGPWTEERPGEFATTCVDGRECVFVIYEKNVAKCALQRAYHAGRLDFEKPLSCHLYPIRVERHGDGDDAVEVLNYEQIDLCRPAIPYGARTDSQLADFLERPLTRRYGPAWYRKFRTTLAERRTLLAPSP